MTIKKRSLADLQSAFAGKTGGSGGNQDWKKYFQFWKAPIDTTSTVRFLPDLDEKNDMAFIVKNFTHELNINGKRETVACLEMHGEKCPLCELSRKYYDEKDPEHNEALGKKYYRKLSYIGQVLVLESPVEYDQERLVHLIDFGPAVFKQIQAAFASGDLEEPPYELKGGYNFRIRKTKNGEYASYTTSGFAPKQSDVGDDVIDKLELFDLKTFRTPKTDRATLEVMIEADRTGATVAPQENAAPAPAPAQSSAAPTQAPAEAAPAPAPAADGGKTLSIADQIRARVNARNAAQQSE